MSNGGFASSTLTSPFDTQGAARALIYALREPGTKPCVLVNHVACQLSLVLEHTTWR